MKRLLAYLFLVLGLGLVFSVNAYSITQEAGICIHKFANTDNVFYVVRIKGGKIKTLTWDTKCPNNNLISKKKYPKKYKKLIKLIKKNRTGGELNADIEINLVLQIIKDTNVYETFINETQIAKKEPSQTQEVSKTDKNNIIYFACLNVLIKDRSTIKNFEEGEEYGFQYFKLDSENSEITVHEQIYDNKPEKIGSIKIDYQGKKTVEFDIRKEEGSTIISDKFKLSSVGRFYKDDGYENYSFEATTYVKTKSEVLDYDFKSKMCLPPKNLKKEEKIYKKWIKSGY